jgi:hypothetical protein
MEYVHTVALLPDDNVYQNKTEALLHELIAQRLSHGYQLVVLPSHLSANSSSASSNVVFFFIF